MDLKEFLEEEYYLCGDPECPDKDQKVIHLNQLGLFFWERGGKQFAKDVSINCPKQDDVVQFVKIIAEDILERPIFWVAMKRKIAKDFIIARDFLDALACLGEEKIKELIKGVEE